MNSGVVNMNVPTINVWYSFTQTAISDLGRNNGTTVKITRLIVGIAIPVIT